MPEYSEAISKTAKRLQALPGVNSAIDPLSREGAPFLGKSREVAYIPVYLRVGPGELAHVSIGGEDFFAKRDAVPEPARGD